MPVKIEMNMPKSCNKCIFHSKSPSTSFELHFCQVMNKILKRMAHYRTRRPPECPLKECK